VKNTQRSKEEKEIKTSFFFFSFFFSFFFFSFGDVPFKTRYKRKEHSKKHFSTLFVNQKIGLYLLFKKSKNKKLE